MRYGANEKVIKEWNYAKTKEKGKIVSNKGTRSIIVTNKRVISSEVTRNNVEHQEIPLSAVKGVYCSCGKKLRVLALLFIIFGLLFIYFGVSSGFNILFVLLGLISGVVGAIFLFNHSFKLIITTNGAKEAISVGKTFINKRGSTLKVKIDNLAANDICESIGAIIVENQ